MKKLFLGLVLAAPILIACSDEASSSNPSGANAPEPSSKMGDDVTKNKTEISYGTMTDPRDGKEYKTITAKMFDGEDTLVSDTWMTEDLAYEKRAIYRDEENGPDTLYSYEVEDGVLMYYGDAITAGKCVGFFEGSAMNCELHLPFQGICPDGWHLPDTVEANRWRTFLKNGDGVGEAFYRPSSSEECDDVDYLFAVTDTNFHFWGLEARPECADKVHDYDLRDASVRCVKGDAYVEPVVVYSAYDGDFETFEDSRDGKSYQTVVIGTQTWMAENLNYKIGEGSGKSFCYNDDEGKCDTYGRLYDWLGALNSLDIGEVASEEGLIVQGVCPENWHLPSKVEVKTLRDFVDADEKVDGKLLKSVDGWWNGGTSNGTDEFGFAALPTGFRTKGGSYDELGYSATFWSWEVTGPESEKKLNANEWYFENGKDFAFRPVDDVLHIVGIRFIAHFDDFRAGFDHFAQPGLVQNDLGMVLDVGSGGNFGRNGKDIGHAPHVFQFSGGAEGIHQSDAVDNFSQTHQFLHTPVDFPVGFPVKVIRGQHVHHFVNGVFFTQEHGAEDALFRIYVVGNGSGFFHFTPLPHLLGIPLQHPDGVWQWRCGGQDL